MRRKRALKCFVYSVVISAVSFPSTSTMAQDAIQADVAKPTRIKLGGQVLAAKLISQPQPEYPPLARETHIEGRVVLHVIISVDGAMKEVTVESGHPLLVQSALDAVRQWRYKPTLLNGKPVEVDGTVTVDFKLGPFANPSGPSADQTLTLKQEQDALSGIDPETAADIRRLLDVMETKKIVSGMFETQLQPVREQLLANLKNLPPDIDKQKIADRFIQMMKDRFDSGELSDLAIPVYAKYFTHEEIKDMLAFYESPTGKRFTEQAPATIRDVQTAASQHWRNVVIPQIIRQLATEFPELTQPKN